MDRLFKNFKAATSSRNADGLAHRKHAAKMQKQKEKVARRSKNKIANISRKINRRKYAIG